MQQHRTLIENPEKTRRDSVRMLRAAWPHRHTHPMRAGIVIRANLAMLRRLRAQEGR